MDAVHPETTLFGATRLRVLSACDACKRGRRKCGGGPECNECFLRHLPCVYTPTNKRRGPRPRIEKRPASVSTVEREEEISLPARIPPHLGPSGISASREVPVLPLGDLSRFRHVFGFTNRMVKVVDETHFLSALGIAYLDGRPFVLTDAAPADGRQTPSSGLRACAFMLLCVASELGGDADGVAANYTSAQDCLDRALEAERPDQHLVSAVLLMTLTALAAGRSESELLSLSSLAHTLADFVPGLSPEIRFSSASGRRRHEGRAFASFTWPPAQAPIGMSSLARMVDLFSFIEAMFIHDFVDVNTKERKDLFYHFCDESIALQASLGVLTAALPAIPLVFASKATLAVRDGDVDEVLEHAEAAFAAFQPERHAGSITCVFVMSHLSSILPGALKSFADAEASNRSALGPSAVRVCDAALKFLYRLEGSSLPSPAASILSATVESFLEHRRRCEERILDSDKVETVASASAACTAHLLCSTSGSAVTCKVKDASGAAAVLLQALVGQVAAASLPPAQFAAVALRCPFPAQGEPVPLV